MARVRRGVALPSQRRKSRRREKREEEGRVGDGVLERADVLSPALDPGYCVPPVPGLKVWGRQDCL